VTETNSLSDILKRIPPISATQEAEEITSDSGMATREAQGYASGNLREVSEQNEHRRNESFKEHVHSLSICGIWAVGALYFAGLVILIWHYVTPWPWLSDNQLHTVTAVVCSGIVTSAGGKYFSKRMG